MCFCCDFCNFSCGLKYLTVFTFLWFIFTLFSTYGIAVAIGAVMTAWPSFGGMSWKQPASGFFGIMMSVCVFLLGLVQYYVFKKVKLFEIPERNNNICLIIMNQLTLGLGMIANFGQLLFSHFQAFGSLSFQSGAGVDTALIATRILHSVGISLFFIAGILHIFFMSIVLAWVNRGTCSVIVDFVRIMILILMILFFILYLWFMADSLKSMIKSLKPAGGTENVGEGEKTRNKIVNYYNVDYEDNKENVQNFNEEYVHKNDEASQAPYYRATIKGNDNLARMADRFNMKQPPYEDKYLELNNVRVENQNDIVDKSDFSFKEIEDTHEHINDNDLESIDEIIKDFNLNSGERAAKLKKYLQKRNLNNKRGIKSKVLDEISNEQAIPKSKNSKNIGKKSGKRSQNELQFNADFSRKAHYQDIKAKAYEQDDRNYSRTQNVSLKTAEDKVRDDLLRQMALQERITEPPTPPPDVSNALGKIFGPKYVLSSIFQWLAAILFYAFILTYLYDLWGFYKCVQYTNSCTCCKCVRTTNIFCDTVGRFFPRASLHPKSFFFKSTCDCSSSLPGKGMISRVKRALSEP